MADGNKLIIAAGFLLGDTVKAFAQQYPNIKFAITDDPVSAIGGFKNEEGITYAAEQSGCLVGVLAAKQAKSMGRRRSAWSPVSSSRRSTRGSPVTSSARRRRSRAPKTLIQYSNSFIDQAACSKLAQNEIGSGAQVIFQVAGLCGDGALKEASKLGKRGIGVDTDEYKVAKRILTSGIKKTYTGVYDTVVSASKGQFKGGKNLVFNLKQQRGGRWQDHPADHEEASGVGQADEAVQVEDHPSQAQGSGSASLALRYKEGGLRARPLLFSS